MNTNARSIRTAMVILGAVGLVSMVVLAASRLRDVDVVHVLPVDGDGSLEATGNVNLLDWYGDGALDISDAVGALRWVTLGGVPHVLAPSECVAVLGCVEQSGCGDR